MSVVSFVSLVVALSIPLWLLGGVTGWQLVDGLPVAASMALCPMIAAVTLTQREYGVAAVRALLERGFDYWKIESKVWYLPILFLKPGIMILSYELMRRAGFPLPSPRLSVLAAAIMLGVFFVAALAEELGWSGYAIDRMQNHRNALQAGVLLGLIWTLWHVVPLVQAHRSAAWMTWHGLESVATRVLIVWVYNNTGRSVFAATLFHAIDNVSWLMFPNFGSHYDPRVTGPLTIAVATIVAFIWGPRSLARHQVA
jgi:membrane protease YdiL (CAAX protease family)